MEDNSESLKEEARAFDDRISERVKAGFIPDLRRAVKCEYFYKSFWRDPQFIELYLGKINETYLNLLAKYCRPGATILDVGCGAGYMSLELARNGYHVTAFDISSACIREAENALQDNPYIDEFGSLEYSVASLSEIAGEYDVVLFSVSLHHMTNMPAALLKAKSLLKKGGHLLCYEPCHDRWTEADAAQVAMMRGLLALTGCWYAPEEIQSELQDERGLEKLTADIHLEYVEERDKHEVGQSPHDNEANGAEMLEALRHNFTELETRNGHSFIYRLLGGIRADEETTRKIADFIAAYDRFAVERGYLNPNGFFFIGRN